MTNRRQIKDSAADAAELAEIDRRAQILDRLRSRIAMKRRLLAHRRRHVFDRIRKRAAAAEARGQA